MLHLELPFAGARMLRDLLRVESFKVGRFVYLAAVIGNDHIAGQIRPSQALLCHFSKAASGTAKQLISRAGLALAGKRIAPSRGA